MKKGVALLLAILATAAVAASAQGGRSVAATSSAISCKSTLKIGFVTPLTGGAGFLGTEQMSWAQYAVKTLAKPLGLKVVIVPGDTPVEQGPAPAQALAQKFVADKSVVAILGPSTSGAVAASSQTYFQAGMAHVSPSATRTSLTKGTPREATSAFLRVVPGDYIQGPTDANYMIKTLHVKKVVLMDFQEPYSVGLSDAVETVLEGSRRHDDPPLGSEHDDRLLGVRDEGAERRGHRLLPDAEAAGRADVRAAAARAGQEGEGVRWRRLERLDALQGAGLVRVELRSGHHGHRSRRSRSSPAGRRPTPARPSAPSDRRATAPPRCCCTRSRRRASPITACSRARATSCRKVKRVVIKNWILGGTFKFSTKSNDPLNAKFYIFQIQSNGSYKLVG